MTNGIQNLKGYSPTIDIKVFHRFHPVGQGLFSAGRLELIPRKIDFQWVYDCGTTSSQKLLESALDNFDAQEPARRLDLVVVSHFDKDHISGIVKLLNRVGTDILMLPWAQLWHRLVVGYSQGLAPDDPYFEFYTDPVKYLNDRAGGKFERIVFVPSSKGGGPPKSDLKIETPPDPNKEPTINIEDETDIDEGSEPDKERADWVRYLGELQGIHKPQLMKMGTAAVSDGVWEFVPYNDPTTNPDNSQAFAVHVDKLRKKLLSAEKEDREKALRKLKNYYKKSFPKSKSNTISLFLYGGPIGLSDGWLWIWGTKHKVPNGPSCDSEIYKPYECYGSGDPVPCKKGSFMYTGDGSLNTVKKWDRLSKYLGKERATKPTILQVRAID